MIRYIKKHFRGELSLLKAFWINLLLVGYLWIKLGEITFYHMDIYSSFFGYALIGYLAISFLIIAPWQLIGIVRTCWRYLCNKKLVSPVVTLVVVIWLICMSLIMLPFELDLSKELIYRSIASNARPTTVEIDKDAVRVVDDGRYLLLQSDIRFGLNEKLSEFIKQYPDVDGIIIETSGGSMDEAFRIAETIETHQLNTYVIRDGGSSGTILFAAGKKRILAETGTLAYHQSSCPYRSIYDYQYEIPDRELAAFYRNHGIGEDFIKQALDTPHDDMWTPNYDELLKSNVIDEVVELNTILKGNYCSASELLDGESLDIPYYQAAKKRFPEEYCKSMKLLDTIYIEPSRAKELLQEYQLAHNRMRLMAMVNTTPEAAREFMRVYVRILTVLLEKDVKTANHFLHPEIYGAIDIQEHVSDELYDLVVNVRTKIFLEEPETPLVLSDEGVQDVWSKVYGFMEQKDLDHLSFKQNMTNEEKRQYVEAWIGFYQAVLEHCPEEANKVLNVIYRDALEEEAIQHETNGIITELLTPGILENNYYQAVEKRFPVKYNQSMKLLDAIEIEPTRAKYLKLEFHAAHFQMQFIAMANTTPEAAREFIKVYLHIMRSLLENDEKTEIQFLEPELYRVMDFQRHVSDELRELYIKAVIRVFSEEPETPLMLSNEEAGEVLPRVYRLMERGKLKHLYIEQDITIENRREYVEAWIEFNQTILEHCPEDANKVLHALYGNAFEEETDTALP